MIFRSPSNPYDSVILRDSMDNHEFTSQRRLRALPCHQEWLSVTGAIAKSQRWFLKLLNWLSQTCLLVVYPALIGWSKVPDRVNADSRKVACIVRRPWGLPTAPTSCHLNPQMCCGLSKNHKAQWTGLLKVSFESISRRTPQGSQFVHCWEQERARRFGLNLHLNKSRCFESQ